jgi:hypothetical protein
MPVGNGGLPKRRKLRQRGGAAADGGVRAMLDLNAAMTRRRVLLSLGGASLGLALWHWAPRMSFAQLVGEISVL